MKKKLIQTLSLCASSLLLCGLAYHFSTVLTAPAKSAPSSDTLSVSYQIDANAINSNDATIVSDTLYGLFLEDINYSIDGGLYAELVKNRSFEYSSAAMNEGRHGWSKSSDAITFEIVDGSTDRSCLNENNPHYAFLTNNGSGNAFEGIGNAGYLSGISVTADETYVLSIYLKAMDSYQGPVYLSLQDSDGTIHAQASIDSITNFWQKYDTSFISDATLSDDLSLWVTFGAGSLCVDMVSMMPQNTYQNLPVRKDMGEYLEALHPAFLRFPGGCAVEGKDIESMYNWKDSIGDVAARPQGKNLWSGTKANPYYMTYGIGFFEYFQLCEALDCLPIPILNAGMTCPIQSSKYTVFPLNSEEFAQCVQDALDLVEFCRGDESTTWGAIRIAMGHPAAFPLTYIGIGNEQWQNEYHAHYEKFVEAFASAAAENPALYGDIELIVANGPSSASTEGWGYIEDYPDSLTTLVDEHYYESPDWFLSNTTRYDSYDRSRTANVFLGEYAAQSNTLYAALAEAAYMTGLERNSDVVKMACYAPLFGNNSVNQWTPDMIFFSNDSLYATPNYYVQQLFANNCGSLILPSSLKINGNASSLVLSGGVGLGTWATSAAFDNLTVTANTDGSILYQTDFASDDTLALDSYQMHAGNWEIADGRLISCNTQSPANSNTGDAVYLGEKNWNNYTLTVDAEILSGSEGFLIPVCVEDSDNQIFWNVGGWGNTLSCLQIVSGGSKSGQISGTVKNLTLKQGQIYHLKVVVAEDTIQCYLDDVLYVNYTKGATTAVYETSSIAENGDLILKLVNTTNQPIPADITISGIAASGHSYSSTANFSILSGDAASAVNSFDAPDTICPRTEILSINQTDTELFFSCELSKYSVTIIRIPVLSGS